MKKEVLIFMPLAIIFMLFVIQDFAAQTQETATTQPTIPNNFEVIVRDNAGKELLPWTGQIFSIKNGKPVDKISSKDRLKLLPPGNYVLMLHFEEDIPEMKGHRPFTFTITTGNKTTFSLAVGASQGPEMETGILRTVKGEDYVNFPLPVADPNLCKAKCEKDRNCGAYTYADLKKKGARCYLIRGAGTPGRCEYCISGVIQRDSSPYRVHITTEKLESEEL